MTAINIFLGLVFLATNYYCWIFLWSELYSNEKIKWGNITVGIIAFAATLTMIYDLKESLVFVMKAAWIILSIILLLIYLSSVLYIAKSKKKNLS